MRVAAIRRLLIVAAVLLGWVGIGYALFEAWLHLEGRYEAA